MGGEDVEDDRGAIDYREPERGLEVTLLTRRELVVAGHQVCVRPRKIGLQLVELARPQVGVGVRMLTALDQLAHAGDPGRPKQLPQLREIVVVAVRKGRDQVGALTSAARLALAVGGEERRPGATVAASLHEGDGSRAGANICC